MSPTHVFESLLAGIGEGRWSELADLYAPDAVVEQPMMPPRRLRIEGRDEVRRHFEAAAGGGSPSTRPTWSFTEPSTRSSSSRSSTTTSAMPMRTTTSANIQVMRIRDGLIVASRDYHDHLRFAALAGTRAGSPTPASPT